MKVHTLTHGARDAQNTRALRLGAHVHYIYNL